MPAPKRRGRPRKDESAARGATAKSTAKTGSKSTSGRKRSTAGTAKKTLKPQGNIIFALDIGTRTVVGVLGYMENEVCSTSPTPNPFRISKEL